MSKQGATFMLFQAADPGQLKSVHAAEDVSPVHLTTATDLILAKVADPSDLRVLSKRMGEGN